jgi:hypothetical protein
MNDANQQASGFSRRRNHARVQIYVCYNDQKAAYPGLSVRRGRAGGLGGA